jgi:hypothetical protein
VKEQKVEPLHIGHRGSGANKKYLSDDDSSSDDDHDQECKAGGHQEKCENGKEKETENGGEKEVKTKYDLSCKHTVGKKYSRPLVGRFASAQDLPSQKLKKEKQRLHQQQQATDFVPFNARGLAASICAFCFVDRFCCLFCFVDRFVVLANYFFFLFSFLNIFFLVAGSFLV